MQNNVGVLRVKFHPQPLSRYIICPWEHAILFYISYPHKSIILEYFSDLFYLLGMAARRKVSTFFQIIEHIFRFTFQKFLGPADTSNIGGKWLWGRVYSKGGWMLWFGWRFCSWNRRLLQFWQWIEYTYESNSEDHQVDIESDTKCGKFTIFLAIISMILKSRRILEF